MTDFIILLMKSQKLPSRVSPDVRFGLQYGPNRRYTGYGYDFLFDAMRDASGKGVGFRPGGGAFDDNNPFDFIKKAGYWSGK